MKSRSFKQWLGVGALTIAATIVQFASVSPAVAAVPAGQVKVRVGDLDLGQQADVAQLYQRIRNAAVDACGADELTGTRLLSTAQQHCVDEAIATAVSKVHNEQLSAFIAPQG
jgi:UrcA family protein